ncbi:LamG domain-containing protein [Candidatus Pacearchaeota archaeon]|nr:LamG domain-containing protein [Candidatus Pacearchaeota archaeon]
MAINKIFIKRVKISGVLITNFLFFGIVFCILLNISFISAVTNCNTQGSCSGSGPFNTCSDSYHCTNSCNNCYQLHVNTAECKIIAAGPIAGCMITSCKDSYANADGNWVNGCEQPVACGSDIDCNTPGICQVNPGHCVNGNTISAECIYDSAPGNSISDTSINANNGAVYCANSVAGKVGQAFSFNGISSYVSIPDSSSLQPVNEVTVSAWIKLNTLPQTDKFEFIVEKNLAGSWASYGLWINSSGHLIFSVENKVLSSYPAWSVKTPLNLGQWYHITGVFNKNNADAGDGNIYIDGNLAETNFIANGYASNFAISYDSGNLNIGKEGGTINSNFMNGIIDEVKIWSRTLTYDEILNEYQNGNFQASKSCALGEDKIIENSGVQVKCLNTNKVTSGNDLTINWAFILKNTLLYDIYHVYPYAKDSANPGIFRDGGNISFVASASPTNKIPSLLPLSPILGESFPNQEANFSYGCSDADGVEDLIYCGLLIFTNETYPSIPTVIYYYPDSNTLNIFNETDNSIIAGNCTPGTNVMIENKNSKINCSKISIIKSGTNASINILIEFKEILAGKNYNIAPYAMDKAQPNHIIYEIKGNWIVKNFVLVNYPPTTGSINPSNGEFFINEESAFNSDYSDANGFADIISVYLVLDLNISDTQKVLIIHYPNSRKIEIRNDINNSKVDGNCTAGENKTISNYYTNIRCLNSKASGSGETINLELDFIFKERFTGQRKFFIKANDANGTSSVWKEAGNIRIIKRILSNCTDSDGGKNYTKKGITNGTNGALIDSCINNSMLKEYYCNNSGGASFVSYKCPEKCSNATCIEIKTTTLTTPIIPDIDKSEVYTPTQSSTTELDKTQVQGKTAGEIVLWSIIWIIIVLFCIILIYFIYSLNKKRALRKKLINKISSPIIRQVPSGYFRPPFRR